MIRGLNLLLVLGVAVGALACRGEPARQPPVHLNPNMDTQDKYKAYGHSEFFEDGRTMRTPPAGTVARGLLKDSDAYWRGQNADGTALARMPVCTGEDSVDCVTVDQAFVRRGQERYDIFCAPCHDPAGYGKGTVVLRNAGLVPPPSYHDDLRRALTDGAIFDAITNGVRTMRPYAHQIPVADRWAIVAYIRALQRSQHAALDDVPEAQRGKL